MGMLKECFLTYLNLDSLEGMQMWESNQERVSTNFTLIPLKPPKEDLLLKQKSAVLESFTSVVLVVYSLHSSKLWVMDKPKLFDRTDFSF